ncbi:MAG TPA: phenylalanine--tRNA ligase subunit beta, partial [Ignavibacteriaceae bacterium]
LIESAYFKPQSVRKTSKFLGLSTDASYHFERGTDPANTVYSAERAAQLIAEVSGGKITKGIIDVYPAKITAKEIKIRFSRISKLLGFEIPKQNIIQILNKLSINILKDLGDSLLTVVPTFRPDIEREVDLIEEVARIFGFDKIPTIEKINVTLEKKTDQSSYIDLIREFSTALGLYEMVNNPLQSYNLASLTGKPIKIANPLSNDLSYLRTSLVPGALSVVSNNIKKGEKNLALFEIGNVFNQGEASEISSFSDFTEKTSLLFLVTGNNPDRKWYSSEVAYDVYSLKGLVNTFNCKISLDNVLIDLYNANEKSIYEYSLEKILGDSTIGTGGKIKSDVLNQFDIEQDIFCFEFDIGRLKEIPITKKLFSEPLKYPKVNRDLAFIFNKNVNYESVKNFIREKSSDLLKSVTIFDIFESKELGEEKKSMAFNLEYYDKSRTLTEEEVEKDFNKLISLVTKNFNAQLRGS